MHGKSTICISVATSILLLNTGCAWNHIVYDRETKRVSNVWAGDYLEHKGTVPCHGSIEVHRERGLFHFGPHGFWRDDDFYGIYFKKDTDSSRHFFFTTDNPDMPAGQLPLKLLECKGIVSVDGRHVFIDIEYQDASGQWKKPPINGRRRIDLIFPDDTRRPISKTRE